MADRKIRVEIIGDADKLSKSFKQTSASANGFGKSMSKVGTMAAAGFAAVGVGAVFAGKKMIGMASDAAEVQSKMEVVFGKALPALTKEIDKFSEATGTSRFAMREQAADMGALLEPLTANKKEAANMSVQFVKLATDLGSFNNVPTEEALLAIRSGLVGEAEPLRRFGVLLNEAAIKSEGLRLGLIKGKEAMTEQEKVQARASLIMKQTTLAQGDATRTADSFANQMKRLKSNVGDAATEIGIKLLPFATKVVGAMNDAAAGVGKFIDKFSAAKGLEAKVNVVLDTGRDLMAKVGVIAVDIGKQLSTALGKVDWNNAGIRIAAGIGDALKRGLPIAGQLAVTLSVAFITAVNSVDWVKVGGAIASGMKQGAIDGIKNFAKNPAALAKVYSTVLLGVGVTKVLGKIAQTDGERVGEEFALGSAGGIERYAPKVKTAAAGVMNDAAAVNLQSAGFNGASLGAAFGAGVASGIASQLGYAAAQAEALVLKAHTAARAAAQAKSPSRLTMKLGKDFADGFTIGMDGGLAQFDQKFKARIEAAMARAAAVVEKARTRMANSFSRLQDKLLGAFDAETSGTLTPAEQQIAGINARRQAEDLQRALAQAQESGDAQAIARAQEDIQLASLEAQAQNERKAFEDQRAAMRERLETRLQTLNTHFQKEGDTVAKAMLKINQIMRAFGITFAESGQLIGAHFVKGLQTAIGGAAAGAGGVRGAQTGGNPNPQMPPIVTNLLLDQQVIASVVRKENQIYQSSNIGLRPI